MKIELLNKENETTTLLLKETNPTEVNMLRRLIVDEVPTLAIEDVTFIDNSSALYDEIVAHRLGLIILKTDLESYNLPSECKGKKKDEEVCTKENCPHHSLLLKLEAKSDDKRQKESKGYVYAEEIESKDKVVKPVHPKTPIVKIIKKQRIEVEARAVMGQGKDHMKFSPGLVHYKGYPTIKIGDIKNADAISELCPAKVFKVANGKLKVDDEKKCILCKACVEASDDKIEIKGSNEDFILTIESWGQLTAKEMLLKALDIMDSKLDEFEKQIKKL
ncbi:DNA-directed RNA polymerase subunit D [Candidatus Woesearchaeota archaeon]|nr:DNA-directed RNA polymerase subunit D [Candidatus Woesearchaeota archaeon]